LYFINVAGIIQSVTPLAICWAKGFGS